MLGHYKTGIGRNSRGQGQAQKHHGRRAGDGRARKCRRESESSHLGKNKIHQKVARLRIQPLDHQENGLEGSGGVTGGKIPLSPSLVGAMSPA